jgi:hypothetical protein
MPHQVEFLIEGYLLPFTMGELRVSEELLLEAVWGTNIDGSVSHESAHCTIAYVGVETPKEANCFIDAYNYLDFFLLIYSLTSGQAVTSKMGAGTTLDDLNSLGARRVGFSRFEKIHFDQEPKEDVFCKPILDTKRAFLQLLSDKDKIMKSHLGLALIYYYFAVLASRRRLEEAVINLMIAAEALLIAGEEGKGQNLANRLSALIAENKNERMDISRKMLKLYGLRSGIVHGEGKIPSLDEVRTLFDYVHRAIERAISLRHLSKEELITNLEETQTAGT